MELVRVDWSDLSVKGSTCPLKSVSSQNSYLNEVLMKHSMHTRLIADLMKSNWKEERSGCSTFKNLAIM